MCILELSLCERHRTSGCSALPHGLLSSASELALSKSINTDVGGFTWGKRGTTLVPPWTLLNLSRVRGASEREKAPRGQGLFSERPQC